MIKKKMVLFLFVFGIVHVLFSQAIVVFDLSELTPNGNVDPKVYFTQKDNLTREFLKNFPLADKPVAVTDWNSITEQLKKFSEIDVTDCGRLITKKDDEIAVYVLYESINKVDSIKITEEKRQSKISDDIKNLLKIAPLAPSIKFLTSEISRVGVFRVSKEYYLEKSKGKIKINVAFSKAPVEIKPDKPQEQIPPPAAADQTAGEVQILSAEPKAERPVPKKDEKKEPADGIFVEFATGSRELFSISADVPLFAFDDAEFTVKDDSAAVVPADTPKSVFIGFNLYFNDVIKNSFMKFPHLKFMFLFSKRPFDAFGVGAGWNLPRVECLEKFGLKTNAICVFGGIFWAKESEDPPSQEKNSRYQFRWGLSYDLSKINEWFKK